MKTISSICGRADCVLQITLIAALVCHDHAIAAQIPCPASEVAFSIHAEPEVGALNHCMTLWGNGWIRPSDSGAAGRSHWIGRAPVNGFCNVAVGFRFVPASNGWASLRVGAGRIAGTAEPSGIEIRDLSGTGAIIVSDRMEQRIRLTSGVPVVVQFAARAASGAGRGEMKRLPPAGTPAHDAVRHFQRGVNLGNFLESPPGHDWGASYGPSDYDAIKAEGFDHVRIPCAWHYHMGLPPDFRIDPLFFKQVDDMAEQAVERGLALIINWHHFDAFTDNPAARMEQFIVGWKQIAEHYASAKGRIAFELLNEPKDAAETTIMNHIYPRVIAAIRDKAPGNTLFVGPGRWNQATELEWLRLPAAESNIIVTIHVYDPFLFTHQGAAWTAPITDTTNIVFPGPPAVPVTPVLSSTKDDQWVARWFEAYNMLATAWNPSSVSAVGKNLRLARAWSDYYGRPVHVGEWGCIAGADAGSRGRYYAAMIRMLRETGLAWAIWDWKSHFKYWNPEKKVPMPGLREALDDDRAQP